MPLKTEYVEWERAVPVLRLVPLESLNSEIETWYTLVLGKFRMARIKYWDANDKWQLYSGGSDIFMGSGFDTPQDAATHFYTEYIGELMPPQTHEIWETVPDANVRHIWEDVKTNEKTVITPDSYLHKVVTEKGAELRYVRTEVRSPAGAKIYEMKYSDRKQEEPNAVDFIDATSNLLPYKPIALLLTQAILSINAMTESVAISVTGETPQASNGLLSSDQFFTLSICENTLMVKGQAIYKVENPTEVILSYVAYPEVSIDIETLQLVFRNHDGFIVLRSSLRVLLGWELHHEIFEAVRASVEDPRKAPTIDALTTLVKTINDRIKACVPVCPKRSAEYAWNALAESNTQFSEVFRSGYLFGLPKKIIVCRNERDGYEMYTTDDDWKPRVEQLIAHHVKTALKEQHAR